MKVLLAKSPRFLNKFKIRNQLILIYITLIFLPIAILGGGFIHYTKSELMSRYETQLGYNMDSINLLFLDISKTNHSIANSLYNNETIQNLLCTDAKRADLLQTVFYIKNIEDYQDSSSISDINIYTTDPELDNVANFKYINDDIKSTYWYAKAINQMSAFYILSKDSENGTYNELTFLQKIAYPQIDDYIIVEVKTSYNFLKSRLKNAYSDAYIKLNGDYFYLGGDAQITVLDEMFKHENFHGTENINGENYLFSSSTITPYLSDDDIDVVLVDKYGLSQTHSIVTITIVAILFIFIVTSFLIFVFISTLNRRLYILKNEVEKGIRRNYLVEQELEGNDEISELFESLKTIFLNFQKTEEIIFQSKLNEQTLVNEQQKMEFKMLSSQINPHFLYNTLETIRMKALTSGNRDLANSIQLLGKSMRYVLENTTSNTTTLARELDYIKTYIDIQNIRFDSNIQYNLEYLCETSFENLFILPLMIQPIVENAIIHGFKDTTYKGIIKIIITENSETNHITREPLVASNSLTITVQDNGVGFDQSTLSTLNTCSYLNISEDDTSESIGIANINKRLKLYYAAKPIHFELTDIGVSASFNIPIVRSEKFETTIM